MHADSDTSARQVLEDLLAQAADERLPACAKHPAVAASAVCAECSQLFCWECLGLNEETLQFQCRACAAEAGSKGHAIDFQEMLREPFFYIAVTVLFAIVAFLLGVGNPDVDDLTRADRDEPWYYQRVGKLWLRQASRAKRRAAMLERQKRDHEMAAWADLARGAFRQAADCWEDAPAGPDLRIGEALMWAKAGDPAAAYHLLKQQEERLSPEHASWPAYLFHRGRIGFAVGEAKQAEADWTELLATVAETDKNPLGMAEKMVESLVDMYSKERLAAVRHNVVREVCETVVPRAEMRRTILDEFRNRNIDLPPGVEDPDAAQNAAAAPGLAEKKEKKKLVIKRYKL